MTQVSIVIKALNEQAHIGPCIESALQAVAGLDGEVVLADSGSSDETIDIARRYPITIVQLAIPSQRRCGIGPQLGYQYATGDYIYVLDGDMRLRAGFMERALARFATDPKLAGVGGLVVEHSEGSLQFRRRKARNVEGRPGPAVWLGMGGLYRRSAIESVGYLSDRNLFAHEEQDLGLRLAARGWWLLRIDFATVDHYGHTEATLPLLRKRWQSGYLFGAGQVLRASQGSGRFWSFANETRHLLATLGSWLWLAVGLGLGVRSPAAGHGVLAAWASVLLALIGYRTLRHRSLVDGAMSVLVWHVNAVGLLRGLLLGRVDPLEPIAARIIRVQ